MPAHNTKSSHHGDDDGLFSIPISALPPNYPGGSIVCSSPADRVYVLALTSPPDNRLTTPVCRALLDALDVLEFGPYAPGVVLTTSGIPRFYSNGLDLEHAFATSGFWATLYSLFRRFLTFPMPTVALLNGHTFAGGLMLATCHDYRLAPSPRGYLCLNELLFGAPLKLAMAAIFRAKLAPPTLRALALEAHRFTAEEAVSAGLADAVARDGLPDALRFVRDRQLVEKAATGVYGVIRAELYKDLVAVLGGLGMQAEETRFEAAQETEAERREFGRTWYGQWDKENKAKL